MNLTAVDRIAKAVLYEGYMLYPYRASAIKNRQRFNFGVLSPRKEGEPEHSEPWRIQAQCIVLGNEATTVEVRVRFLHLIERTVYESVSFTNPVERRPVDRLEVDGEIYQSWQEAIEREISFPATSFGDLQNRALQHTTTFPASSREAEIRNSRNEPVGTIAFVQHGLKIQLEVEAHVEAEGTFKLTARVENLTEAEPSQRHEQELLHAAVSTHIILAAQSGKFVSFLDPPTAMRPSVDGCHNVGGFPVLIGERGADNSLLFSPIVLYDYPEIADESAGDLFDSTEIDEILSLRIMTLTEEEKREMRGSDPRAKAILERTESLPEEQLVKLHGAIRGLRPVEQERAG